jgi:hypothetical protein
MKLPEEEQAIRPKLHRYKLRKCRRKNGTHYRAKEYQSNLSLVTRHTTRTILFLVRLKDGITRHAKNINSELPI